MVAAGVLARAAGTLTDFWLDEIWTVELARGMRSPLDVLTQIHHSNNHHLNTLFVFLLGQDVPHWGLYRLLSLAAGLGAVALLARIAARQGRLEAWLAGVLGSTSYLLVFHAAEARGYALVVFFALLAFLQLERLLQQATWMRGALFGLTVLLGFLSHLQFVHVYSAALAWTAYRLARSDARPAERVAALVRGQLAALLLLAGLYWIDVRRMHIGGGPPYELLDVLGRTAALALGLPRVGWLPAAALVAAVALALWGIVRRARRGDDAWVFYLVAILLSPALLLAALRPEVLFERYFVISHAFLLLLAVELLAAGLRAGGARKAAALALLSATIAGNSVLTARYLRDGSGRYLEALEFIARETPGPTARVASDNDGRAALMIGFYQRWLPPGERIEYVKHSQWPDEIGWVLVHSFTESRPKDPVLWIGEVRYDYIRRFPRGSHSGWDWFLFRRGAPRPR